MHLFQDLEQSPAFVAIAFAMQNAFAFEIHVIDERVTTMWHAGHARELAFHIWPLRRCRFIEHFGERLLQSRYHELRLKIDSMREKLSKLAHPC